MRAVIVRQAKRRETLTISGQIAILTCLNYFICALVSYELIHQGRNVLSSSC